MNRPENPIAVAPISRHRSYFTDQSLSHLWLIEQQSANGSPAQETSRKTQTGTKIQAEEPIDLETANLSTLWLLERRSQCQNPPKYVPQPAEAPAEVGHPINLERASLPLLFALDQKVVRLNM